MIYLHHQILLGDQTKNSELDEACGAWGRQERSI